jgi:hypothetical protein
MTSTLPAALVIGIAQHTTRGTSRPFVPIIWDDLICFYRGGVQVQNEGISEYTGGLNALLVLQ